MWSYMYIVKVSRLRPSLWTCEVCVGFCGLWVVMLTPHRCSEVPRLILLSKRLHLFPYFSNRRVWFSHRRCDVPKASPIDGSFFDHAYVPCRGVWNSSTLPRHVSSCGCSSFVQRGGRLAQVKYCNNASDWANPASALRFNSRTRWMLGCRMKNHMGISIQESGSSFC